MYPELSTSSSPGILSPFLSISLTPSFSLSLLFTLQASMTLFSSLPPSILALTHYELLAALMYSQYSLYHISAAAVCQGSDRERRKRNKERKKEGGRGRG